MKIYVYYEEDGRVGYVRLLEPEKGHTIQDYYDKAKEYNGQLKREAYVIFDIEDEKLGEAILYLLGEKKYKRYADIDDLDDSINSIRSEVVDLYDTAFDMNQSIERIEKLFEKVKESFEKLEGTNK